MPISHTTYIVDRIRRGLVRVSTELSTARDLAISVRSQDATAVPPDLTERVLAMHAANTRIMADLTQWLKRVNSPLPPEMAPEDMPYHYRPISDRAPGAHPDAASPTSTPAVSEAALISSVPGLRRPPVPS